MFSDGEEKLDREVAEKIIKKLKDYKGVSKFKRAAMNILVKMAPEEDKDITELRNVFQIID